MKILTDNHSKRITLPSFCQIGAGRARALIFCCTASLQLGALAQTPSTDSASAVGQSQALPAEFARYPGAVSWSGKKAAPILDTKLKRRFRTVLRNASQEAADFNGHYRLARWGCGMNCIGWAIINQRNGQVWMGDYGTNSCWAYQRDEALNEQRVPDWFEYSLNSRLLYSYVCDDGSGRYVFNKRRVYLWPNPGQNGQPKLIRSDDVKF